MKKLYLCLWRWAHINLSCEAVDISVAPKGASEGSMFPCDLIQINL
jgi:hypothetical protein